MPSAPGRRISGSSTGSWRARKRSVAPPGRRRPACPLIASSSHGLTAIVSTGPCPQRPRRDGREQQESAQQECDHRAGPQDAVRGDVQLQQEQHQREADQGRRAPVRRQVAERHEGQHQRDRPDDPRREARLGGTARRRCRRCRPPAAGTRRSGRRSPATRPGPPYCAACRATPMPAGSGATPEPTYDVENGLTASCSWRSPTRSPSRFVPLHCTPPPRLPYAS